MLFMGWPTTRRRGPGRRPQCLVVDALQKTLKQPFAEPVDERFTTAEANELLSVRGLTSKRKKARRDQLAAQLMLAAYLESDGGGQTDPGAID